MMEHGGRIYHYAELSQFAVKDVIDCSANINPLGPPPGVRDALDAALDAVRYYPDSDHEEIRRVLSDRFTIDQDTILCANGATECIEVLIKGLRPNRCVVLEPAFSEYAAAAYRLSCPVVRLSLFDGERFVLPIAQLDQVLLQGDLLFINHPHNPSGTSWPLQSWIEAVFTWAKRGVSIAVDESFADFLPQEDPRTVMQHAACVQNVFVIRSATKIFSIPGLRFGFLVGTPEKMALLKAYRDPWSVNHLAQVAARVAYEDLRFTLATAVWLKQVHHDWQNSWAVDARWHVFPTSVNFFLLRFSCAKESQRIQGELMKEGIYLRPCGNFQGLGDEYVRIALLSKTQNERVFQAVSALTF